MLPSAPCPRATAAFLNERLARLEVSCREASVPFYDDAGVEVGRALLRFDPKTELPALVRSFRPRVRLARLSNGKA